MQPSFVDKLVHSIQMVQNVCGYFVEDDALIVVLENDLNVFGLEIIENNLKQYDENISVIQSGRKYKELQIKFNKN